MCSKQTLRNVSFSHYSSKQWVRESWFVFHTTPNTTRAHGATSHVSLTSIVLFSALTSEIATILLDYHTCNYWTVSLHVLPRFLG